MAVQSLVDHGQVYANLLSHKVPNGDYLALGGKAFPNFPPGMTLLLSPYYWLFKKLLVLFGIAWTQYFVGYFSIFVVIFLIAPALGYGGVVMHRFLCMMSDNENKRLWLVFTFAFGTLLFFYSRSIWSHDITTCLVLAAFYFIVANRRPYLVGSFAGMALLLENLAIVPTAILLTLWIYRNIRSPNGTWRDLSWKTSQLLIGLLPFLGMLFYFNRINTGSYLRFPVLLWHSPGQAIIQRPSREALWGLSFAPIRGIFLYVPITILFVLSFFRHLNEHRFVRVSCGIIFLTMFFFNASYCSWGAGSCYGPRYLIFAMPFIILPVVVFEMKWIRFFCVLSIFVNTAGVNTQPSDNIFKNILVFLYRGPHLEWLEFIHKNELPKHNIHIHTVTPCFIYIATLAALIALWRVRIRVERKHS